MSSQRRISAIFTRKKGAISSKVIEREEKTHQNWGKQTR